MMLYNILHPLVSIEARPRISFMLSSQFYEIFSRLHLPHLLLLNLEIRFSVCIVPHVLYLYNLYDI